VQGGVAVLQIELSMVTECSLWLLLGKCHPVSTPSRA
jgi:hypothetical protein